MALIENRRARHDYEIQSTLHAGIVLTGGEVKSVRQKSGSLQGSFVKVVNNELFLLNAQITPYKYADNREYDPKRTRKLLVKKREIYQLAEKLQQKGLTLVPLAMEIAGRHIKLVIGLGRGKKQYEHRATLRQRDIDRDIRRNLKDHIRLR